MRSSHGILALAAAAGAQAAAAFEFHGYFRDPMAFNGKGGGQVCFQHPAADFKPRLGNECDHYWELQLDHTVYQDETGLLAKVSFMPAYGLLVTSPGGSGAIGYGSGNVFTQQMWGSLTIPQLAGATFWAGQRYYRRHNVESDDWFYWNPYQGNTAIGVEEVGTGIGKLAFAVGRTEAVVPPQGLPPGFVGGAYLLAEARIYDIPVSPQGALEVGVNLAVAYDQLDALGAGRRTVSPWLTVEHWQKKLLGGFNRLTFQWARGATAIMQPAVLAGADGSPRQWRVIEQLLFDPTPSVSGQLVLAYADQRDLTGGRITPGGGGRLYTAELRPAYHFTSWFKIQVDAFFQTFDFRGSDAVDAELWKVTFAPTLVAGRGFLARPELRLFVTWADWNGSTEALGDAAGAPIGSDVFGTDTSGLVFGAHVEAWW